uniref:Mediator of RNA polymerase II transcription subunit 18 n=1 Tax=Timema cristinae TaxID=61476 RepID=A0A7R9CU74_TIMCR|nr:unnamed protein product [Timema cristinae]
MDSIVPNQEYLLQGSVMDSAVEVLLHRLRGLCDNVDSGPETFHDHEMRAVDYPEMPWQLRYIGQPEVATKRPTIVRSSLDIGTSSTVVEFLTDLGCRMDFEYAARGYMFRKGRMKITVAKIFKMLHNKPTDPVETISQSYLVELSVLAPCGQDAIAEDMRSFSEQLRPLVQLEKVDFNRLHHLT